MSDLQIGLIVLGIVLILAVLCLNWWQDRRVRRRMQAHFPTTEQDPLLGGSTAGGARREPGMGAADAGDASTGPGHDHVPAGDDAEEADPASEVVIDVAFPEPVSGDDLIPYVRGLRSAGRKPIRVFAETDQGVHRARLYPGESYASLQIAVLLANRSGPLTAIEWSQAWARAQDLAERFDAAVEGPDQQEVLERAARLDDTCAALDTQVGLTLMLGGLQPSQSVLAAAREMGFVPDGARLAWMSETGLPRFTLSRADGAAFDGMAQIERLNLLLDVPRSPPDDHAFGRMVQVGRQLAERLGGSLVDDQGRPLQEGSEVVIDQRLQVLYGQLEQAGLTAGGPRALRVFS